jgi:hypothetical protein
MRSGWQERDGRLRRWTVSPVAIGRLGQTAHERNVIVDLFAIGAEAYAFERASFDLIVLFYHFDRRLFPRLFSAGRCIDLQDGFALGSGNGITGIDGRTSGQK